ncbi:MAG: Serine hydrolase, partial [Pseudonocardiales bacterium]|nr:Serine hydrolase [Pseudonocardiales bacterium]
MPRRPVRSVPTVIVPGWQGSGEGHWQTWLEEQLQAAGRATCRPEFADLDEPDLADWKAALRAALDELPPDGFDVVA